MGIAGCGGMPEHLDFWSPPFFYPVKNAAAYSDVLLSVGPVYWLWRALGASPDLSFGLWMMSMSALNYAAGLLLFRKGFGFGMPAAVAGASLVAFGAPRLNQMGHQQLLPFFFPLLALYALSRLVGDLSLGRRARAGYWLLAMAAIVAQLYAAVYLGWFLILGLGLAAVVALAMRPCRVVLLEVIKARCLGDRRCGAVGARVASTVPVSLSPGRSRGAVTVLSLVAGASPQTYGPGSMWAREIGSGAGLIRSEVGPTNWNS